jgi:hypothetical protein
MFTRYVPLSLERGGVGQRLVGDMSDWKALIGRVTLFPAAPSPSISALTLFDQIWGGDPDSFQRQTNPLMPTVAQAKRKGMSASCSVHPTRIDFSFEPAPTPATMSQPTVVMIEDTSELKIELTKVISELAKDIFPGPVVRIALYLQFSTLSKTFLEANSTITAVIPKKYGLTASDEEDFIFQINRPHLSRSAGGIKLNILTKWSVERIQLLTISVPQPGIPMQQPVPSQDVKEFIAPSVVMDNNTPPRTAVEQSAPFSGPQQVALLTDALELASETQKEIGLNVGGF